MFENIEPLWVLTGILFIHLFFFIGFQYQLLQMLEELAFPSEDPIMTSSLKEPVYEYEEEEAPAELKPEEESEFDYAEEPPNIDPNHGHDLDHIEEVEKEIALEEAEVEIFTEGLEPRRSNIPFLQSDFPPVTLAQLKRLPKAELVDLCEKYEKETDGTKADLVKRLID